MDKQIIDLETINSLDDNDKFVVQTGGGNSLNISKKDLLSIVYNGLKDKTNLAKEEVIYQYTGSGKGNYDRTVTLSTGFKFSDYLYIEVYAVDDDGYSLYQKLEKPRNGDLLSFNQNSLGGGRWFYTKTRTFILQNDNQITTHFTGTTTKQMCAGMWSYQYMTSRKTSEGYGDSLLCKLSEEYVGIYKIVGLKLT